MISIALASVAAIVYGAADFLAGIAARRASVVQITLAVYATGTLAALIVVCLPHSGHPSTAAVAWGAVGGFGLAWEALLLAEGFRRAEFSIAGPLSAVVGAGLAVVAGLVLGERPGVLALAGAMLAFPAILTVSASAAPRRLGAGGGRAAPGPRDADPSDHGGPRLIGRHGRLGGIGFGVTAGLGCAISMVGLGRASAASGVWPVLAAQAAALVTTAVIAAMTGNLRVLAVPGSRWPSVVSGILGAAGAVLYVDAVRTGILAIAAVISGLFPVVTVILARVVEQERLGTIRLAGLGLAIAAVTLTGMDSPAAAASVSHVERPAGPRRCCEDARRDPVPGRLAQGAVPQAGTPPGGRAAQTSAWRPLPLPGS